MLAKTPVSGLNSNPVFILDLVGRAEVEAPIPPVYGIFDVGLGSLLLIKFVPAANLAGLSSGAINPTEPAVWRSLFRGVAYAPGFCVSSTLDESCLF